MPNQIHVEDWVKRAELDYYIMFIKAWIPYNAWYKRECSHIPGFKTTDRNCIEYLCDNVNLIKTKIITLLGGIDNESLKFRSELAELHKELSAHVIPDEVSPINFSTMVPGVTSRPLVETDFRSYHYKIERTPAGQDFHFSIRVEDKVTHAPRYSTSLTKWDITQITSDPSYNSITSVECKRKIIEYFNEVNPNRPLDIVLPMKAMPDGSKQKPAHSLEISRVHELYFVEDKNKIAKVIIRLLYQLRCEIFHGSLKPSESNMAIYEHAYFIQYQLIKELI